jgi:hypothetical protein
VLAVSGARALLYGADVAVTVALLSQTLRPPFLLLNLPPTGKLLPAHGYSQNLMHVELRISETLHNKPCCIGPVLCATSENAQKTNFGEFTL